MPSFIFWKDQERYLLENYGLWIAEQMLNYPTYNREQLRVLHKECKKRGIPFSYIRDNRFVPDGKMT